MDALASDSVPWLSRLLSALRTGIACLLVLLGVSKASRFVEFPVFGYVVTVLVLSESALGKALEDAAFVMYGTLQAAAFSMVVLSIIGESVVSLEFNKRESTWELIIVLVFASSIPPGTKNFSLGVCLTCIFVKSFLWSYLPNQKPVKKRLALAITTIVYVNAYNNPLTHPVFFPLKLTLTTTLGTVSAIIALIFPVPRLSAYQVQYNTKLFAKLAMENFAVLVHAFCSNDQEEITSLCLQSKSVQRAALKAYSEIQRRKVTYLREGNSLILTVCATYRLKQLGSLGFWFKQGVKQGAAVSKLVQDMTRNSLEKLGSWSNSFLSGTISSFPKSQIQAEKQVRIEEVREALLTLHDYAAATWNRSDCTPDEEFRRMFFLFTVKKFVEEEIKILMAGQVPVALSHPACHHGCKAAAISSGSALPVHSSNTTPSNLVAATRRSLNLAANKKMVIEAFKIALSMVIAVYLGVLYRKDYGYWSTITVALGLFNHRTGTFKSTSLRLQGTALGTVYGYLVALTTHQALLTTIFAILPWLAFTSFMRKSKLLELTGASTAYTSAVIIVGRRRPGIVQDFAVLRMAMAVLGLGAFMAVEALICSRRAARLARRELELNLKKIQECMQVIFDVHSIECSECFKAAIPEVRKKEQTIRDGVERLRQLTAEARAEPDFWHAPFHDGIYSKLWESQSRITELLSYLSLATVDFRSEGKLFTGGVTRQLKISQIGLSKTFECTYQSLRQKRSKAQHTADIENQFEESSIKDDADTSPPEEIYRDFQLVHSEAALTIGAIGFCCHELLKQATYLKKLTQELLLQEEEESQS
ncbi:uncharacterized protein LOC9643278 [Selaginella moellendorffii]|uniref:uncharacterized protein LOC9643278 n=1 Tax=Selaginella moellendorffii TaxID=88036 RepID=UPI000D1D100F|nr:uncharacterized protein LOC9643278 [Selaginella moellendorffii]|eukprot:XP_024516813.1 uncharacterized protein LOC9643278 [Selaginella moellendorffii]